MKKMDENLHVLGMKLLIEARHLTFDAMADNGCDAGIGSWPGRQVRSFFRAAGILAMAMGAVHQEQVMTARDQDLFTGSRGCGRC